ncbi:MULTISPECIES: hypothetical protein [Hyphomicrobium]|jgi:hypothetical protein|uniref:hypothetical protein n=1 Tax=Hyphomicrobium TaxID=81 RepID=UPI00036AD9EE|nr:MULTISPECIES: hypothetical protein [Hyphomicrobium]WBT40109.1 hypothetical protein PE058_09560 [Hyphomicrobium sp. DMF-1]HML42613.1 hypothetical protein [Hyphomicrobium zavarzinii]
MLTISETPLTARQTSDLFKSAWNWAPFMQRAATLNAEIGAAFADWSKEYVNFLQRRSAEDMGLLSKLGSCTCPTDFAQTYQTFLLKASQDYQDEYAKLARIGTHALVSWTNPHPEAARH